MTDPDTGTRVHTAFARIDEHGTIQIDTSPMRWRTDTGNRPTDQWLHAQGYYSLVTTQATIDPRQETLTGEFDYAVDHEAGVITATPKSRLLTAEELAQQELDAWNALRLERNRRLAETDWTQLPDAPETSTDWRAYRQALRDLPQITTDPFSPPWPELPEG
jgi:hypothetical protein